METVKCVCVGDGSVGKTCMIISYIMDAFPENCVPSVIENYQAMNIVDDLPVCLCLWDTAGQTGCSDAYEYVRPICYPRTDVFLVCYSVNSPSSLENIKEKWIPEIRNFCPNTPIVIVGTQADVRKGPGAKLVDIADAKTNGRGARCNPCHGMQCQDTSGIEGRFRHAYHCQIQVKDQETQQMCVAVKASGLQQELIACMCCRQVELFQYGPRRKCRSIRLIHMSRDPFTFVLFFCIIFCAVPIRARE